MAQNWLHTLLFLPFSCKMTVSVLSQARHKEHHSDTLYSEDSGSQPCAKVAAQIFGHCTVWSTTEYVMFFFYSSLPLIQKISVLCSRDFRTLTRDGNKASLYTGFDFNPGFCPFNKQDISTNQISTKNLVESWKDFLILWPDWNIYWNRTSKMLKHLSHTEVSIY